MTLFHMAARLLGLSAFLLLYAPAKAQSTRAIQLNPIRLSAPQQQTLLKLLDGIHKRYDDKARMLSTTVDGYQYHRDATSGTLHEIRGSMVYALALLNTGDAQFRDRAHGIIAQCVGLQDTLTGSPTRGIWGYYLEEPLQTKKSPPDFNMADFNAVTLLDVWMSHGPALPPALQQAVRRSLVLAAGAIQKRNMGPHYTNIAVMGSYVTYLVGHLFDLPTLQTYGRDKIETLYQYTLQKGGFTEYNSPTYTITALEDLNRMQLHIVEPGARQRIDSLYTLAWSMLARHYHAPSGQWSGPHSRAYRSLVLPGFYNLLHEASEGKLFTENPKALDWGNYGRLRHRLPPHLLAYFTKPTYPRTERDVFEPDAPPIVGTSYLTDRFALSSSNRSSMWNQRRPLLAYWGTPDKPRYLQLRFLHDEYDFSSASFYSEQRDDKVLAAINLSKGAGDKHIHIDLLKDGTFEARDLRLRFELGNVQLPDSLRLPNGPNQPIRLTLEGLPLNLNLFEATLDTRPGRWEKGGNGTTAWLDYVIYSGPATRFDLNNLQKAIWGLTLSVGTPTPDHKAMQPQIQPDAAVLKASWQGMSLSVPKQILPQPKHVGWY